MKWGESRCLTSTPQTLDVAHFAQNLASYLGVDRETAWALTGAAMAQASVRNHYRLFNSMRACNDR